MKKLFPIALLFFAFNLCAAEIKEFKSSKSIKSKSIRDFYRTSLLLQKRAEDIDSPYGGRDTRLFTVKREKNEKEWQAILDLTDYANPFADIDGEDLDEEASAYRYTRPSLGYLIETFFNGYLEYEQVPKTFRSSLKEFRNDLRKLLKNKKHVVYYRIFSSNESQGHLGYVLYNRNTREALYVSTISEH